MWVRNAPYRHSMTFYVEARPSNQNSIIRAIKNGMQEMSEGKRWISWPDKWIILVHNSNHFHQVLRRELQPPVLLPMLRFPLLPSQLYSFILVANFAFPSPLPQQTFPIRKPVKINQKKAQKTLRNSVWLQKIISSNLWEKFCFTQV